MWIHAQPMFHHALEHSNTQAINNKPQNYPGAKMKLKVVFFNQEREKICNIETKEAT